MSKIIIERNNSLERSGKRRSRDFTEAAPFFPAGTGISKQNGKVDTHDSPKGFKLAKSSPAKTEEDGNVIIVETKNGPDVIAASGSSDVLSGVLSGVTPSVLTRDESDHRPDVTLNAKSGNPLMIQIIDGLYLGNAVTAQDFGLLRNHQIKGVVNVTPYCCNHFMEMCDYLNIAVTNDLEIDISSHFSRACDFIHERVTNGNSVLVHCMQGRGRSVTIILAYLIYRGYTLADAYQLVKEKRNEMFPNMTFFENLMAWERTLSHSNVNSMTREDFLFKVMCEIYPHISEEQMKAVIASGLKNELSYDAIAASFFSDQNDTSFDTEISVRGKDEDDMTDGCASDVTEHAHTSNQKCDLDMGSFACA